MLYILFIISYQTAVVKTSSSLFGATVEQSTIRNAIWTIPSIPGLTGFTQRAREIRTALTEVKRLIIMAGGAFAYRFGRSTTRPLRYS
jgi:hypothetical protein